MKSQALSSIAVIIIQVLSTTPHAQREVLRNAKCTGSSRNCIYSIVCLTNHLLDVSLKTKTDNISIIIRRMSTEERAKAVGMLQRGAGIRQVSHFSREHLHIPISC